MASRPSCESQVHGCFGSIAASKHKGPVRLLCPRQQTKLGSSQMTEMGQKRTWGKLRFVALAGGTGQWRTTA
jgi:hypothetical protein